MSENSDGERASVHPHCYSDYGMQLRREVLGMTDGQPTQDRADALNLLEMILEGELNVDEMVEKISDGDVPVRYVPMSE